MLWVTGNKGLLGSALLAKCREKSVQTGREVDISDLNALRHFARKHPLISHIINCAAFSGVDAAENFREEAYLANAVGPENLAIVAKEMGAKLIHISTDYVFDGKRNKLLTEEDPTHPLNHYGKTKLEGEERALQRGALVIRTSWLFGSRGKNFVSNLLKMLQTEEEVRLVSDQWGRFTYAPDLAEAILQMLFQEGLYQFANIGVTTRHEFGLAMREEASSMGYSIKTHTLIPTPSAAFPVLRPTYSALDTTKIERFLQLRHWREALKDFLCEQMPAYL